MDPRKRAAAELQLGPKYDLTGPSRGTVQPAFDAHTHHRERNSGKHELANKIEEQLFLDGKFVYFLGVGNIKRGSAADIQEVPVGRDEHIRRLAEVSHLFLDAGAILIVTGLELIRTTSI